VLIALNRTGGTRSYWAGFAVVGLVYFVLVPCHIVETQVGPSIIAPFDPDQLLTTRLSREAYSRYVMPSMPAAPVTSFVPYAGGTGGFAPGMSVTPLGFAGGPAYSFVVGPNQPASDDFVKIADLLWTVLFAFVGGWISLAIWATGPKARRQGASDDQPAK
jgi:hypothetical protein